MFFDDKKREELHSFLMGKISENLTPDEIKTIKNTADIYIKTFMDDIIDNFNDSIQFAIEDIVTDIIDTDDTDETENDVYNLWENEEKEEKEENDIHNHGVNYNEY